MASTKLRPGWKRVTIEISPEELAMLEREAAGMNVYLREQGSARRWTWRDAVWSAYAEGMTDMEERQSRDEIENDDGADEGVRD